MAHGLDQPAGHVTDFDFLAGEWSVVNRRLRRRWEASDDWDEFDGSMHCEQRLGGVVNIDEMRCPKRGFTGMTVRVFDLDSRRWSISWINSTVGKLEPPVFGGFVDGVGTFAGRDTDGDRAVSVRFTWTVTDDDNARWQQAFSTDEIQWETNWIMEFTRVTDRSVSADR